MPIRRAGFIDTFERDNFLKLHGDYWPQAGLRILEEAPTMLKDGRWGAERWEFERHTDGLPRYLWRRLSQGTGDDARSISEAIVRFPSAPLFGSQRKRDYQVRIEPVNYHTLRVLRSSLEKRPARRIYLLFNGLNETDNLDFYHELSGFLLRNPDAACILCPFPGHLMRYPMVGRYAERPLDRFIRDPSDLFRQYLRFMVEMRWLLSILVPIRKYPVYSGMSLLAAGDDLQNSRYKAEVVAEKIGSSWSDIREYSLSVLELNASQAKERGKDVTRNGILQTVQSLRDILDWRGYPGHLRDYKESLLPPPLIHVIGYSLGGYLAQSVFFSWPYAISSCTTMCSGGALPDLRLVRFAHEEEWRSVMHGLKYEIEAGMVEGRIRFDDPITRQSIAGLPATIFGSFFRIFSDVFLQDPNGSYRSRVSEFSPRLLFVVGGNDPIVTTRSVLDASPPEGINMIEIANLSHFVATDRGEWRDFWLPTVAEVADTFAGRAELLASRSVLLNLWNPDRTGPANGGEWPSAKREDRGQGNIVYRESEALASERFQAQLMELVDPLKGGGFLFIMRNRIPTALMGPRLLHKRGTVPHYEDWRVRSYWAGLQHRRREMLDHADRIALVVPRRLNDWFLGPSAILSSKNEPTAHAVPSREELEAIWRQFLSDWETTGALFRFDPENPALNLESRPDAKELDLERMVRKETRTEDQFPVLNCLPDLWIGLSAKVVDDITGLSRENSTRERVLAEFQGFVCDIFRERTSKTRRETTRATRWLDSGDLAFVRVSGAESNPRFLGERIWHFPLVTDLLVHSSLALGRSVQCQEEGDFSKAELGSV